VFCLVCNRSEDGDAFIQVLKRVVLAPRLHAANARWRAREARAQVERDAGIPDELIPQDFRDPFPLPLKSAGWKDLLIEPRLGYVSWRAIDSDTGEVLHCAALKELLRWIAAQVPRMLAARNFH
jgi:hypothetical protein